jgi:hypothetical protein
VVWIVNRSKSWYENSEANAQLPSEQRAR